MKKMKTTDICLCAMFTALTAVGAFIKIPLPLVPATLQGLFTTMAGLLLGARLGGLSVLIYIVMGLIGIPIFTQGSGIGYVLMPTFGYMIGFAAGAWLTGSITQRLKTLSFLKLFAAALAGLAVVYIIGVPYVYIINLCTTGGAAIGIYYLLVHCFLIFLPKDIAMCAISALLAHRLIPLLNRLRGNAK